MFIEDKGGCSDDVLLDRYAYRVSDTVRDAIHGDVSNDPVAKQYIPTSSEMVRAIDEDDDPIGDEVHTSVKGIVHRYPDRVLFKLVNVCAVYCRYCFRREMVGPKAEGAPDILTPEELQVALDYIRNHEEIYEVILTGGDPLVMSARQLSEIMEALKAIPHVQVIRIHSRVPIADPGRLNSLVIKALTEKTNQSVLEKKAVYIVVHVNHAQEITDDVVRALAELHKAGVNLFSQSVLLRGVNDNADILESLFRRLVALNVKPYYLHHPDHAPGTSHFRVSIEEGQKIMRRLLGRLSGLAQPTYMLDIPGGHGKVPLTPCYIESLGGNQYKLTDYQGEEHDYG